MEKIFFFLFYLNNFPFKYLFPSAGLNFVSECLIFFLETSLYKDQMFCLVMK